ncbi:hypothetical protein OROGR_008378 [Orobanche gracilis]
MKLGSNLRHKIKRLLFRALVDPTQGSSGWFERDEIIEVYVQLVAKVLKSEDEARKKIYSVSTKYYFAVGVLVSKDMAYKWKALNEVKAVIAGCYVDRATKDYGGEPFVDGKPVPYDPKLHAFYHRVQEMIRDTSELTEEIISDSISSISMKGLR